MKRITAGWVTLAVLLCTAAAGARAAGEKLRSAVEAVVDAPEYRNARWGLLVSDLESGEVLYERNADQLFTPASTTKLFSVAAALDALGADYRFRTPIYRRGDVDAEGRLNGDLILVASGDLTMGGRTDKDGRVAFANTDHIYAGFNNPAELTSADPLAGLDELARQVARSGIRRVDGEVLIDDRLFVDTVSTGSGPARVTPVQINDNLVDFTVRAGTAAGSPAAVEWRPKCAALQVDAQIETVAVGSPPRISTVSPSAGKVVLRGSVPAGHAPIVMIREVEDPLSWARSLLIEALGRAGVRVEASALAANREAMLPPWEAVAKLPRTAELVSPPFSENAKLVLKVSHNLHASTLPLLVAVKHGKRTLVEGLQLQREFLAKVGVDADTISFGGGAGGSPSDMTTPRATVQLLRAMAKRPDFPVYRDALPVLGVDGTLATSVAADSPARGKVWAKTGTYVITNPLNGTRILTSKALAGYVTAASGRKLAVSFVMNNRQFRENSEINRQGAALARLCEAVHSAL